MKASQLVSIQREDRRQTRALLPGDSQHTAVRTRERPAYLYNDMKKIALFVPMRSHRPSPNIRIDVAIPELKEE